jgi:hypothetical protein
MEWIVSWSGGGIGLCDMRMTATFMSEADVLETG